MSARTALPPAGLCADCRYAELLRSARSTYLRCRRADTELAYPRYPQLPVIVCAGYESSRLAGDEGPRRARR